MVVRRAYLQLAGFLAASAVAVAVLVPATVSIVGATAPWVFPVFVSVVLLVVTWIALRSEHTGLSAVGLVPTRRRVAEFGVGFGLAAMVFACVGIVRAASIGAVWSFDLGMGARAALVGLPIAFVLMFSEELLFRGYAFQKAVVLWGAPVALVVSSLLFGAYHVLGSGYWGAGAIFLFIMPTLGGLVFGLAAIRSGGLALPLGLHLGGNWVDASVLGLGLPQGDALWTASIDEAQRSWLLAPDLLPRLPYLVGVTLLVIAVHWWTARAQAPAVQDHA